MTCLRQIHGMPQQLVWPLVLLPHGQPYIQLWGFVSYHNILMFRLETLGYIFKEKNLKRIKEVYIMILWEKKEKRKKKRENNLILSSASSHGPNIVCSYCPQLLSNCSALTTSSIKGSTHVTTRPSLYLLKA